MCAELRTMAASKNRDHPTRSLYYCLFAPHTYIFVLPAHPVRGESHNQRNTTGEVATGLGEIFGILPRVRQPKEFADPGFSSIPSISAQCTLPSLASLFWRMHRINSCSGFEV